MTELHDHLKLLCARRSACCTAASAASRSQRAQRRTVAAELLASGEGARVLVTFSVPLPANLPWTEVARRPGRAPASAACWSAARGGSRPIWRPLVGAVRPRRATASTCVARPRRAVARATRARAGSSTRSSRRSASARGGSPLVVPDDGHARAPYSDAARVRALRHRLPRADRRTCSRSTARSAPARPAAASAAPSTSTRPGHPRRRRSRSPTAPSSRGRRRRPSGSARADARSAGAPSIPIDVPWRAPRRRAAAPP